MSTVRKNTTPRKDLVKLRSLGVDKTERKFEKQHALKLLRLPNSAWEIAEKSKVFVDNEIKRKRSNSDD